MSNIDVELHPSLIILLRPFDKHRVTFCCADNGGGEAVDCCLRVLLGLAFEHNFGRFDTEEFQQLFQNIANQRCQLQARSRG